MSSYFRLKDTLNLYFYEHYMPFYITFHNLGRFIASRENMNIKYCIIRFKFNQTEVINVIKEYSDTTQTLS